jgi:phosphohistidine phosphatase
LETAYALHHINKSEITIAEFLSADSTVEKIANKVINDDNTKTLLIIGHQPNLGLLIAKLLGMHENACVVKKGAVWWLLQRENDGALQTYLFTVHCPDL